MKWYTEHHAQLLPMALTSLILAAPVSAADAPMQKREKALLQRIEKSDSQVATLQKRIEQLESQLELLKTAVTATTQPSVAGHSTDKLAQASASSVSPAATPPANKPPADSRTAPGAFAVDEEAAQRALERTLTQSGALLLSQGTFEISPSIHYRRVEQTVPTLVNTTNPVASTPDLVAVGQHIRRNETSALLEFKAGLPYQSQLEVGLPYQHVSRSQVTELGTAASRSGSGLGDATLGIAKTLSRESGWKPDLIGRLTYNFGNGERLDNNVDIGGGYRQIQAELVALKRQDPLAFVASAFYSKSFEKNSIKPGDAAGFSLTSVLAASPATSLQFGFSQIHRQEQEFNGGKVRGSDQTYGIATLGASSVLSRDMTLVTQVGIGLGNDAPKYSLTVSLPILFR